MKRLVDTDGLYNILEDTIMDFMKLKPQPYGTWCLRSQEDFWNVPVFKRALTFVFLMRFVLGYPSQRLWKKFAMSDYKFNTRSFKRWCDKEADVFAASNRYNDMPDKTPACSKRSAPSRPESTSESSPFKRHFVVNDESTSDEE